MTGRPLVSVVTPFYNTADYLAECIESVLAQTYASFEYLLVDNQSTDGSAEIAKHYAKRDSRIRVIRNRSFVGQVANYNGALRNVSLDAKYVKIVQADDLILPECLDQMVRVAEAHPTAAIISSYYLMGRKVYGAGIDWPVECVPGRVASRLHLVENCFLFGTPTTLLYRASLVAARQPFYSETSLHEDTELCHEVLATADFGFVHQVLSYTRVGNGGILCAIDTFHWQLLDFYVMLRKCGSQFLSSDELAAKLRAVRADYMRVLGESSLLGREEDFWKYHRRGLATIGEDLPSTAALAPHVARAALKAVVRPRWIAGERARLRAVKSSHVEVGVPVVGQTA
jgi:glycosyltransferase involved in cell wall biosynthesis